MNDLDPSVVLAIVFVVALWRWGFPRLGWLYRTVERPVARGKRTAPVAHIDDES